MAYCSDNKVSDVFDWDRMTKMVTTIRDKMKLLKPDPTKDSIETEMISIGGCSCRFFMNPFDRQFYLRVWTWHDTMNDMFSVHAEKDEDFGNGIRSTNMYFWFMKNIKSESDYLELQKILFTLT